MPAFTVNQNVKKKLVEDCDDLLGNYFFFRKRCEQTHKANDATWFGQTLGAKQSIFILINLNQLD